MSSISYLNDFQANAEKSVNSKNSFKKKIYEERYNWIVFSLPDIKAPDLLGFLIGTISEFNEGTHQVFPGQTLRFAPNGPYTIVSYGQGYKK